MLDRAARVGKKVWLRSDNQEVVYRFASSRMLRSTGGVSERRYAKPVYF